MATYPSTLSHHLLTQVYNNAWANHRLGAACAQLDHEAFRATRTGFFPSIQATLNHILIVDWFYIDALEREADGRPPNPTPQNFFVDQVPCREAIALRQAQRAADGRLLRYYAHVDDGTLDRIVTIVRPQGLQQDTRRRLLAHLFEHQTHCRFPFNLSLLIFQLALLTLSSCHQPLVCVEERIIWEWIKVGSYARTSGDLKCGNCL